MTLKLKIPGNVRYTIAVVLVLLALNFLLRVAFLLYNTAQAKAMEASEIFYAFLIGIRYDLATIFLFNGLLFLILVTPLSINRLKTTYKLANILILVLNIPILLVNAIDVVYFGFAEKRLTHELYTTKAGDMMNFNFDVLKGYWYFFVIFGLFIWGMYKVLKIFSRRNLERVQESGFQPRAKYWMIAGLAGLVIFLGARGGIQRKPLNTAMAFVDHNLFVGKAGLNSAYTIISSVGFSKEKPVDLLEETAAIETTRGLIRNSFDGEFPDPEFPFVRKAEFEGPEEKYNVVILIVESFNASMTGCINGSSLEESLTPNFDTLSKHGLLMTNFFANGARSVESLPSILNSLPDIFRRPAISTPYLHSTTWGIGNMLASRGYHTGFFCGGPNGTLGFDEYSKVCGFENYYGKDEYPYGERDYDGLWGCYDLPFLSWMGKMEDSLDKPFLSVWFSISNHHPFHLPARDAEEFRDLDATDMEKTHAYTDKAIGHYFKQVRQTDWYDNTYFIITGDHTFHEMSNPDYDVMDYFHVPFLLIGPCVEPRVDETPANHINVLPTLIDLLKLDTWHASMGVSLFDREQKPFVIHNQMGVLTLANNQYAYTTNFERFDKRMKRDHKDWIEIQAPNEAQQAQFSKMEHQLRGFFQTAHNSRIRNQIMSPEFMH